MKQKLIEIQGEIDDLYTGMTGDFNTSIRNGDLAGRKSVRTKRKAYYYKEVP